MRSSLLHSFDRLWHLYMQCSCLDSLLYKEISKEKKKIAYCGILNSECMYHLDRHRDTSSDIGRSL